MLVNLFDDKGLKDWKGFLSDSSTRLGLLLKIACLFIDCNRRNKNTVATGKLVHALKSDQENEHYICTKNSHVSYNLNEFGTKIKSKTRRCYAVTSMM